MGVLDWRTQNWSWKNGETETTVLDDYNRFLEEFWVDLSLESRLREMKDESRAITPLFRFLFSSHTSLYSTVDLDCLLCSLYSSKATVTRHCTALASFPSIRLQEMIFPDIMTSRYLYFCVSFCVFLSWGEILSTYKAAWTGKIARTREVIWSGQAVNMYFTAHDILFAELCGL